MRKAHLICSIAIFILMMILQPALYAQEMKSIQFPERARMSTKTISPTMIDRAKVFQEQSGWGIRWNYEYGSPASMMGTPIIASGRTPRETAYELIEENWELFNLYISELPASAFKETRLYNTDHIVINQYVNGLRVEGSAITMHYNNSGIYFISAQWLANPDKDYPGPLLTEGQAYPAIIRLLGSEIELEEIPAAEQVLYSVGDELEVAWKFIPKRKDLPQEWVVYISAVNGELLGGYEKTDTDSPKTIATGSVYLHAPDRGNPSSVNIEGLYYAGYALMGDYVRVFNEDTGEAYEEDCDFTYDPSNTHFDEVMVYYHTYRFQAYYLAGLNYPYLGYPGEQMQIQAKVHFGTYNPGSYATPPNTIKFGDGYPWYPDYRRDNAKEDNVIYHEIFHLVTELITYDGLDGEDQEESMDEGYSDYFGASYADTSVHASWVNMLEANKRKLDNNYTMDDWQDLMNEGGIWWASQIFSGALWDLRQELGQAIADEIIFVGLGNLSLPEPEFLDARDAILAADIARNSGSNIYDILEIFADRGIGSAVPGAPTITYALWKEINGIPEIHVKWTRSPLIEGVTQYELLRAIGDGEFSLLAYVNEPTSSPVEYHDQNIKEYQVWWRYKVRAINYNGDGEWSPDVAAYWENWYGGDDEEWQEVTEVAPDSLVLNPNYPNPFNPITQIRFGLPEPTHVRLQVLNTRGQQVRIILDEDRPKGWHTVMWDGKDAYGQDAASGIYFYVLEAQGKRLLKKMVLVR